MAVIPLDISSQTASYDQNYFTTPIKHKIKISGSFAELRTNHFHMGIDFKSSRGISGDPIYAAAEGYVSRIKIQSGGYGNSLYIDHPNGYTTVYAHLLSFDEDIAAFIKEYQYKNQVFEIDIDLDPSQFKLKKGQQIGKMGSTGRSTGPHLHFEIRETESEIPVNPFLFGIKPSDSKRPDLRKIRIYAIGPGNTPKHSWDFPLAPTKNGLLKPKSGRISIPYSNVGIGIEAYDYMDGASNRNGLYSLRMKINGEDAYSFTMDKVGFDETLYLNAHIDYKERSRSRKYFQKCFVSPGNKARIYGEYRLNQSMIKLGLEPVKVEILATDVEGNKSRVEFDLVKSDVDFDLPVEVFNYLLDYSLPHNIQLNGLGLNFVANSFYENLELFVTTTESSNSQIVTPIYHIHNDETPVHKYFDLAIQIPDIPEELREKACILKFEEDEVSYYGGTIEDGIMRTKIREFGSFAVAYDTIAPNISPVIFKKDLRKNSRIKFKIKDQTNLGPSGSIASFNGYIDDSWVLFEYDAKNDMISHTFDKDLKPGKHSFRLEVKDGRNNISTFSSEFTK